MGRFIDTLAGLISIGAGLYLLSTQAVADNSLFEVIAHGIGGYFVAKGLFMLRAAHLQSRQIDLQERALEWHAYSGREKPAEPGPIRDSVLVD